MCTASKHTHMLSVDTKIKLTQVPLDKTNSKITLPTLFSVRKGGLGTTEEGEEEAVCSKNTIHRDCGATLSAGTP